MLALLLLTSAFAFDFLMKSFTLVGLDLGMKSTLILSDGSVFKGSQHKAARWVAKKYDIICTETFSRRSIFSVFFEELKRSCKRLSKQHVAVDMYFPSTIMCCKCKAKTGPTGIKELHIREWICFDCQSVHNRDVNAAINIRNEGIRLLGVYAKEYNKLLSGLL